MNEEKKIEASRLISQIRQKEENLEWWELEFLYDVWEAIELKEKIRNSDITILQILEEKVENYE